jgi:ribosomal protein S18 acetylase RimI-like enzyme
MNIKLRHAQPGDEDFLFQLYASTRQDEMNAWGWAPAQQEMFLKMQFRAQRMGYASTFLAATHQLILNDDQPIGRVIVNRTEADIRVVDIAILPDNRNQGVGATILRRVISEAQKAGKPVVLQVAKGNPAIHLYQRVGFLQDGEDELFISMFWRPTGDDPTPLSL